MERNSDGMMVARQTTYDGFHTVRAVSAPTFDYMRLSLRMAFGMMRLVKCGIVSVDREFAKTHARLAGAGSIVRCAYGPRGGVRFAEVNDGEHHHNWPSYWTNKPPKSVRSQVTEWIYWIVADGVRAGDDEEADDDSR